jgi:hypothetical protein
MPAKTPEQVRPDNPEEYQRFVELARDLEADESPGAMDRAFERVVKPKKSGITPKDLVKREG